MQPKQIPCSLFPLSIVCVDDNSKLLSQMSIVLENEHLLHIYSDPVEALNFLQAYKANPFINRCISEDENQSSDKRNMQVDIRSIRQEINNPERFTEIGLIILDYAMPTLNGGDLAKELQGTNQKIILLTGEADTKIAVDLFNQGIIHSYIHKQSSDFKNTLKTTINNLQYQYFSEMSAIITNSLALYPEYPHSWFEDAAFQQLFKEILSNNLIECYLLDEYGGYLFLNKKGEPSILAVTNAEMIDSYLDYAKDDEAPQSVIEGLKSKKMIPFFLTDEDFNVRPADWAPYMQPAKVLHGQQDYYYAYITDTKLYKLDKIVSFEEFLNKQV